MIKFGNGKLPVKIDAASIAERANNQKGGFRRYGEYQCCGSEKEKKHQL